MNINNCKIVFLGTPNIAAQILEKLLFNKLNIIALLTQPQKSNNKAEDNITTIQEVAKKNNIPVYQPVDKTEITHFLAKLKPELLVVVAYGQILSQEALELPTLGAINIHGSLLPKYRGPSPIQTALKNGDQTTGLTFIKMVAKMDAGPVLVQKRIIIDADETTTTLTQKMTNCASENIIKTLNNYISGAIIPKEQNEKVATYCQLISKNDGLINWQSPALKIERLVRAYNLWPIAFTFWQGKKLIIINCHIAKRKLKPGEVRIDGHHIYIGTTTSALDITKIQLASKKIMTAKEFINGHQQFDFAQL